MGEIHESGDKLAVPRFDLLLGRTCSREELDLHLESAARGRRGDSLTSDSLNKNKKIRNERGSGETGKLGTTFNK